MHKKAPFVLAVLSIITDWLAVLVAVSAAFWIRFVSGFLASPQGIPEYQSYLPGMMWVAAGWVVIFAFLGLYELRKGLNWSDEALLILKGTLLGALFTMAAGFLYRDVSYSRIFLVLSIPFSYLLLLGSRMALRRFRASIRKRGYALQRVLIVGEGRIAAEVRSRIGRRPDFGYQLIGHVTEGDLARSGDASSPGSVTEGDWEGLPGVPLLGSIDEIAEVARRERIDRIFIALPNDRREETVTVIRACEKLPVEFDIVPDLFGSIGERMRLSEIDGIPLLGVKGFPLELWNRFVKRSFDIALSSLLLLLFFPLLPLLAMAIRIDTPGSVFYGQTRIGRDGRVFRIFKFRTMITGAESETGPVWAERHDSRSTRIGAILRRTSLDELPQLWNVLVGQMALVGPRPERPHFVRQFEEDIPRYFDRHRVKSGMTGWAQVNGLRGNTSIEERTRFDVFYVENWSLLFDLKILLLTFRHLLRHAAATR